MIDIHLHLDGSLTAENVLFLAKSQNIELPAYNAIDLKKYLTASNNCDSLNDYLSTFDLPLSVMQTSQAITYSVESLIGRLADLNMIYTEIRFAPQYHTRGGLTQKEVVKAAIKGLNNALLANDDIDAQLILCCMRGSDNEVENLETISVAEKNMGHGVCAVDLAGAEALYKTQNYKKLFQLAKEMQLPFTIHAGEADDSDSIKAAIDFGATRIGHGVRSIENKEVMQEISKNGIYLELCPTSNLQTKAVKSIKDYPIRTFMDNGIRVTVNTDNMTVSDTSIDKEMELLKENSLIVDVEKNLLLINAANAAFLNSRKKEGLLSKLRQRL